jgi:hypothetical protein
VSGKKHVGVAPTLTQPLTTPQVYCGARTKPNNRNNLHQAGPIMPVAPDEFLIRIKM